MTTSLSLFLLCISALTNEGVCADGLKLTNPNATVEAQKLYEYLNSIQGKQMLSGHHVMYGGMKDRDLKYIVETTGKYPALIEFEGGVFAQKYCDDFTSVQKQIVKDAVDYWKAGGIVAVCWHWGNPLKPRNTYPNTKIKFDIEAACTQGTPENEAVMKDLDVMAVLLKDFQDAKVPVLFRPLHEICGGWFWWSMQGEETAEKLWRFIYTYYTERLKLNNVIWVYAYSHEMRTEWFPGLEYIDVVGADIYKKGQTDEKSNFDRMASVAGNKPIALSECEEIPDPDVMNERGFIWNYFSTWHSRYVRKNAPGLLKKVYQHESVVTRDETPDWIGNDM